MVSAPSVGRAFSPLDEELELLPGSLTPHAGECLVRLGAWLSFGQTAQMLAACVGVQVSEATVRRHTEVAGAAFETLQTAEAQRLEREMPRAPAGPDQQLLSVDGANVPLIHGDWAEVKTLALGVVESAVQSGAERVVHTAQLSYFSRMQEATQFSQLALVEIHRRGVETAGQVVAVMDGAEWQQGFVDFHCPAAVRVLDFPHAAERVSGIAAELYGKDTPLTRQWLDLRLPQLKHTGPATLLAELRDLHRQQPAKEVLAKNLAYLEKREAQMHYPEYQAQGWPIGSGSVESANKVVVEARLKGAGKHWAREHVNPMVALRTLVCNDRWDEGWPQIVSQLRAQETQRRQALQDKRRAPPVAITAVLPDLLATTAPDGGESGLPPKPAPIPAPIAEIAQETLPPQQPYRPPAQHPWRHSTIGRARFRPYHWDDRSKT
jgi:hypothetical protein